MLKDHRKIEIVYISKDNLLLDNYNPRLAGEDTKASQEIGRAHV